MQRLQVFNVYGQKTNGKENQKQQSGKKQTSVFSDERFKISFGLFMLFFAAFLTLALVSYLFTWKTDQSFEWQQVFSSSQVEVENWSGKVGAYFANLFITKWFGLASFSIPFMLVLYGLRLLNINLLPFKKTLRVTLAGTIMLSLVMAFIVPNIKWLGSGLGGSHGMVITQWLNSFMGPIGTAFMLLLALFVFTILSFPASYGKLKGLVNKEHRLVGHLAYNSEPSQHEADPTPNSSGRMVLEDTDLVFETEFCPGQQRRRFAGCNCTRRRRTARLAYTRRITGRPRNTIGCGRAG
ncbi:MAG: hypothetical protein HC896_02370 [Bacteroidales bacterium]|nr:hypothetical protein [Bacteroidales bacterium]